MKKLFSCMAVAGLLVAFQPGAFAGAGCCPGASTKGKAEEAKSEVKTAKAETSSECSTTKKDVKKSDCTDKKDCTDKTKADCEKKSECDVPVATKTDESKG